MSILQHRKPNSEPLSGSQLSLSNHSFEVIGKSVDREPKFTSSQMGFQILSSDVFGEEKKPQVSKSSGHTKVCARGHWRPAEDTTLKELVAKHGPQNWNLIAENLHGRSGNY